MLIKEMLILSKLNDFSSKCTF